MQQLAHQVPPDPHRYTVDAHAGPNGIHINGRTYNADEFAQIMRHDPHWDGKSPIRLIGCDTGSLPDGFAHDLSRKLGVPVTAPTHAAWTDGHGRVFSTSYTHGPNGTVHPKWPPDGEWKTFHPDGSSHPAGHGGFPPGHEPTTHHDGTHHPEEPPKDARARGEDGEHHEHGDGAHPHEPEKVAVGKDHDLSPPKSRAFGRDEHGKPVTLEPNKSYDVTDKAGRQRGTFVTDEHGHIKEVHTTSGQKGDWRPDARDPLPNADYHITGHHGSEYHFHTDSEGRTVRAEGDLVHTGSDAARRSPDQAPVGHEGRDQYREYNRQVIEDFKADHGREPQPHEVKLYDDVSWNGGHLFGTEFDGPGEYINMVPMLETLNQNQPGTTFLNNYRALEQHWGTLLNSDPPHKIAVHIEMGYTPGEKAPTSIKVHHRVDGIDQTAIAYKNVPPRP